MFLTDDNSISNGINPSMSKGGGVKLPPRFHSRIFGTEKYTTACVYDFS